MLDDNISEHILLRPGFDRILEILANRHRRLILLLLKEGAVDSKTDILVRDGDEKEKQEIALTHSHLPRLDEAGYIEWERETGEISKGPNFEEIEPLLELIENHADELPADWP